MFTIKHVSPDGYESLYEAIEVNFKPEPPGVGNTVWYTLPGTKEIKSIDRGWAYVTNETGATVAKYNLNDGRFDSQLGNVSGQPLPDVGHFMKQDGRIG